MHHFSFLFHFIGGAAGSTVLLVLAIMLGTFFIEDPTTIVVGILAADGVIPTPLAILSLYAGILFGDLTIYFLGYLASTHPKLARYVDHDLLAPFRAWLETRYILTVFSARFIPGARLPTYASSGFFRSSLSTFVLVAIGATTIWTSFLFSAAYWFGSMTTTWLAPLRWGIAIAFLLLLFFVGKHNIRAYRAKRDELRKSV